MEKRKQEFVYLVTHSCGAVIDGIVYDESYAKYLVDALNKNSEQSRKCMECRFNHFESGKEYCDKAEIRFNSSGHGSRCTVYCVNDVNDELNKGYIKSPDMYDYQKINAIDVKKMLREHLNVI